MFPNEAHKLFPFFLMQAMWRIVAVQTVWESEVGAQECNWQFQASQALLVFSLGLTSPYCDAPGHPPLPPPPMTSQVDAKMCMI